jgi:hypothetical protein
MEPAQLGNRDPQIGRMGGGHCPGSPRPQDDSGCVPLIHPAFDRPMNFRVSRVKRAQASAPITLLRPPDEVFLWAEFLLFCGRGEL